MFESVLVANRGEIACRIIRTLRDLGIRSIAVYSDADAGARHVGLADVAVRIGPAPAARELPRHPGDHRRGRQTGAEAIHPGYGFLSENADFARACAEAGIVFVGPGRRRDRAHGRQDPRQGARRRRAACPIIPGAGAAGMTDAELIAAAAGSRLSRC